MYLSKKLISVIVAIVAIAAGTTAFAAIPDENGVIHGCYDTKTGALRVMNYSVNGPSASCAPKEAGLTWNQQGPPGPKGDKGDPGPSDGWGVQTGVKLIPNTGGFVELPGGLTQLPAGAYLVSGSAW